MKIAVLQGGTSAEREVSLRSGENCCQGLRAAGAMQVTAYDTADLSFIDQLRSTQPDLVFNALHGKGGEDGTIQGLLELLNIPYTGSGVLASALAMDKHASKKVFDQAGLTTPRGVLLTADTLPRDLDALYQRITQQLGTGDLAVKPNSEGSSVGVSLISTAAELGPALKAAQGDSQQLVIVEECIAGKEITVGVLQDVDGTPYALPLIEIIPKSEFYHFENKYTPGYTTFVVPAQVDQATTRACQELAVAAHQALGCAGYSRSDIRLTADNKAYLLETNTLPGLTAGSLIPCAAKAAGIEFPELLLGIIACALAP